MKKNTIQLATIIIILFFFCGCGKYHRDRYIGTWDFVTERVFSEYDEKENVVIELNRDTIYYVGTISLGNSEGYLLIEYSENEDVLVWLDEDGYMYTHLGSIFGYSSGLFDSNKKMHLTLRWSEFTDLGFYDTKRCHISGTKKKGGKK
ncbi:MAG: hypothetical protein FWC41_11155 [Firmicutes bacterium]|nr:hypothetical protein [Bacillota bacterium]